MSRRRSWLSAEEDPLGGVANLFDVAMVFAVALLVSLAVYLKAPPPDAASDQAPEPDLAEQVDAKRRTLEHWRISHDRARGKGKRLGTAYQLEGGEVVYVPE